jgi:hypothetical protein
VVQPPSLFANSACRTVNNTLTSARQELEWVYGNFSTFGHFQGTHFTDLFTHGAWLDFTSIPVLNEHNAFRNYSISTTELGGIMYDHLVAGVINAYWRAQRVWIMGYPMTQSDCTSFRS